MKDEMDKLGLVYDSSNFRKGCVSCTGIEFCNLAVAETKNRMIDLVEQLETTSGWYKDKIRIHFSGCPSSCGQHQIADIGFRGAKTKVAGKMVDAYDLFVGGRLGRDSRFNELLKGKILAADVHLVVDSLLKLYASHKQGDEIFSEFLSRSAKAGPSRGLAGTLSRLSACRELRRPRGVPNLTCREDASISRGMSEIQDAEDRLIRRILIAIPAVVLLGFLATVALITVMISYNFNILDWLE